MKCRLLILFILSLSGSFTPALASHIVGGELYYKCTGWNYNIKLNIYQDCIHGEPTAIEQDIPAFIAIFNLTNGAKVWSSNDVFPSDSGRVEHPFDNDCVNNPPVVCLNRVTFTINVNLQPSAKGYRVIYMRCCRNAGILNIIDPQFTGATYFVDIPGTQVQPCNNTPEFKTDPPQIICVNNPLVYDHSAGPDPDGDSLSYEFCEAFKGGDISQPKPEPQSVNLQGPVKYVGKFPATRPMGGNPIIQINPVTGMITGTPTEQGRYIVTVCCHEWRNGVKISTIRREFQFVVTNCSKKIVANIPQFSSEFNTYIVECSKFDVFFVNHSTPDQTYLWDFGVPNTTSDTSPLKEPTFTYPDTGTYNVTLWVNKGTTCSDSITRIVKVYPYYTADFEQEGLPCPRTPLQFTDLSVATYNPIISWEWNFGDGNFSAEPNPVHSYVQGGDYNVSLVSTSIKGCKDTAVKTLNIERFEPFAGNDTVIVKGESIHFNARGGVTYIWTPSSYLEGSTGPNPVGRYPDTGRFAYNVYIQSFIGCEGNDSIVVLVVNNPYLFVPSAFTPNGDGLNDRLRPIAAGFREVKFFRIFNRFGQMVFETTQFQEGWDGRFHGREAEMGAYYWVLGVINRFGQSEQIKGDVTLLR